MSDEKLILEVNEKTVAESAPLKADNVTILITPPIDEDFWLFRVKLSEAQAIVGFPKFGGIGIGFAKEEDWNTNLPYQCEAQEIYDHISHNKGDDSIPDDKCLQAIRVIRDAAKSLKAEAPQED